MKGNFTLTNNIYADTIITGGNTITMNPQKPRAQAIAIKFGRILAAGSDDEIKNLAGPETRILDARTQTVIPGLNDGHCHALWAGRAHFQVDCGPDAVKSIAEIKQALARRAKETPPGTWIIGHSYDDTKMTDDRYLNRHDLDEAAGGHPVWVQHVSGHLSTTNSLGLKLAGLSRNSDDPVGGRYGRDPQNGELNGIIYESAQKQFNTGDNPLIPHPTVAEDLEAIRWMCREAASIGLTSISEALTDPVMLRSYQAAYTGGDLSLRSYLMLSVDYLERFLAAGLRSGLGDDMLRIGPIKILGDGAIAGRTAYLGEPYEGSENDYGILATTPETLTAAIEKAHRAGFQISVHANGDAIIKLTLDAYEQVLVRYPRADHRHRIEHCTVINDEILARIKQLGIVVLPFGSYIYYHGEKMPFYGKRISMMFAHRSFLDNGIVVGGSSDHNCAPWYPLAAIQSCVIRKSHTGEVLGPEQRITLEQALWVYTMGSANTSFSEGVKGSLEEGKYADMVFLADDPTSCNTEGIKDIPILATMMNGNLIYRS